MGVALAAARWNALRFRYPESQERLRSQVPSDGNLPFYGIDLRPPRTYNDYHGVRWLLWAGESESGRGLQCIGSGMLLSEVMMRKFLLVLGVVLLSTVLLVGIVQASPPANPACWGQASAVFAQTGEMGYHSSQQPTPRLGLQNLARALYDAGVIDAPTMQALGVFVATELGLSIDACGT
jgi:hypothetical protein